MDSNKIKHDNGQGSDGNHIHRHTQECGHGDEHTHPQGHGAEPMHEHPHIHGHEDEPMHEHEHPQEHEQEYEYIRNCSEECGVSNEPVQTQILTHLQNHEQACEHGHDAVHTHPHVHTQTKNVLNRLSKASGHLESVRRMVENDRDCTEVLVQLAAVVAALNSTAKVIIKDHIEGCLMKASGNEDLQAFEDLCNAIDKFIK